MSLRLSLAAVPFGAAVWFLPQPWRGVSCGIFLVLFVLSQRQKSRRPNGAA